MLIRLLMWDNEHSSAITLVGKFTQLNLAFYPALMVLVWLIKRMALHCDSN